MSKHLVNSNSFMKDLLKLTKSEQKQLAKTMKLLSENIKHPSLNCHEVKGTVYHEVYVNMDLRLIFEKTEDFYVLHFIGHHDILDKL